MLVTDTVALDTIHVGDDGYLEGFARTARTGIQHYNGREMGRPDLGVVNVYRDETEVFSHKALHSFSKIPLCVDHPPEAVTASNWKKYAVGTTGDDVLRDGQHLKIGIKIKDAAAVKAVNDGKRELSVGYTTKIVWGDGVTADGQAYQARQTEIVANHIAIVDRGRAGAHCRIGDSWTELDPERSDLGAGRTEQPHQPNIRDQKPMHRMTIDGVTVELSDTAREVVTNALAKFDGMKAEVATKDAALANARAAHDAAIMAKDAAADAMKADHSRAISAKDGEIDALKAAHTAALSTKDGEIDALKAKMPDAAALDAMIADRERVITAARKMLGDSYDPKGKSVPEIRKAAVLKRMGDAAAARDDSYVAAAFDALTHDAKGTPAPDPVRNAMIGGSRQVGDAGQVNDAARTAHNEMKARLTGGWNLSATKGA